MPITLPPTRKTAEEIKRLQLTDRGDTVSKAVARPASLPRYLKHEWLTPEEVYERNRITINQLRKMRMRGVGPRWKRFGHRTILYDAESLAHYMSSLPGGGS